MAERYTYLFGPVFSRRLGHSLGIDIIPYKTCTFDCIYCECGPTTCLTVERCSWFPRAAVMAEIDDFLLRAATLDYFTFAGSGEPTLNSDIGWYICELKKRTTIPVAVLTNGALLAREEVRNDLLAADVVIPSLDAVSSGTFKRINRPHPEIQIEEVIKGISQFRKDFSGHIWLEILFVKNVNDSLEEVRQISEAVKIIQPDKIQIGTVVRPPAEQDTMPVSELFLEQAAEILNQGCEIIGIPQKTSSEPQQVTRDIEIVNLLKRRPTTIQEMSHAFNTDPEELRKQLHRLERAGKITSFLFNNDIFFKPAD